MYLFNLPVVVLEHIFSYLTYDEIAKSRIVCKDFDEISRRILNRGFHLIERRHALCLKAIKAMLPRRESERRFHNLARHCDILTSIETRLSMLSMTYSKYIDNKMCCFIPGKVIDEIRRVLGIVENSHILPRAHEVLQELRDISSMAIEHFDDKVVPDLRMKMVGNNHMVAPSTSSSPGSKNQPPLAGPMEAIKTHYAKGQRALFTLARRLQLTEKKMKSYKQQLRIQKHMILIMSKKQAIQNANIAELKKRIEECDVKYRELTHSQSGIKVIAGTSHSEVCSTPTETQPPVIRHYSSQIRLDPTITIRGKLSGRDSPNIKRRKTTVDHPTLNSLCHSLAAVSKRQRLSDMSMEELTDSESDSSQDIRDITCDVPTEKRSSQANSDKSFDVGENVSNDFKTAISRLSKATMDLKNAFRPNNTEKNKTSDDCILDDDDCILLTEKE